MDDKCGGGGGGSSAGFSELPGFDESELTGDDADILTYGLDELDDVDVVPYCIIKMFIGDTKEEVGKKILGKLLMFSGHHGGSRSNYSLVIEGKANTEIKDEFVFFQKKFRGRKGLTGGRFPKTWKKDEKKYVGIEVKKGKVNFKKALQQDHVWVLHKKASKGFEPVKHLRTPNGEEIHGVLTYPVTRRTANNNSRKRLAEATSSNQRKPKELKTAVGPETFTALKGQQLIRIKLPKEYSKQKIDSCTGKIRRCLIFCFGDPTPLWMEEERDTLVERSTHSNINVSIRHDLLHLLAKDKRRSRNKLIEDFKCALSLQLDETVGGQLTVGGFGRGRVDHAAVTRCLYANAVFVCESPPANHHTGVTCDGCGMHPIVGVRHKRKSENFDYCAACYEENAPALSEFQTIEFRRRCLSANAVRLSDVGDTPARHEHPRGYDHEAASRAGNSTKGNGDESGQNPSSHGSSPPSPAEPPPAPTTVGRVDVQFNDEVQEIGVTPRKKPKPFDGIIADPLEHLLSNPMDGLLSDDMDALNDLDQLTEMFFNSSLGATVDDMKPDTLLKKKKPPSEKPSQGQQNKGDKDKKTFAIAKTWEDEYGRIYCEKHRKQLCNTCCFDFTEMNLDLEEELGLRKKRSEVERLVETLHMLQNGMRFMEDNSMDSGENYSTHKKELRKTNASLRAMIASGQATRAELELANKKYGEKYAAQQSTRKAIAQEFQRDQKYAKKPSNTLEYGGEAFQRYFDAVASKPPSSTGAQHDRRVCAWCKRSSHKDLKLCSRCKSVAYCSRTCQRAAWKGHKKECLKKAQSTATPAEKPKTKKGGKLPLTWGQLEAYGMGVPALGEILEVRAMVDNSFMRQVFECKDRAGIVKNIAIYTDDGQLEGLASGSIVRWKNPRFHHFLDGSTGARVENGDVPNIEIVDNNQPS
jgi:hypothetical protein